MSSWISSAARSGWRRMRASQVTSDSTRRCESIDFTMWWMFERRASSAPGPARDHQQRHALGVRGRDRVHDVVAARAVGHADHAEPAGRARVAVGREADRGLVRERHHLEPAVARPGSGTGRARDRRAGRRCASRPGAAGRRPRTRRAACAPSPRAAPLVQLEPVERRDDQRRADPPRAQRLVQLARAATSSTTVSSVWPFWISATRSAPSAAQVSVRFPNSAGFGFTAPSCTTERARGSRSPRAARAPRPRPPVSPGSTSPPGISSVTRPSPCRYWRTITSSSAAVSATTFTQSAESIR